MFQFTHPGKGATPADGIPRVSGTCFNSRTLGRVRRLSASALADFCPFQFTHPGKGATELVCCISSLLRVSIHAPWEGCDFIVPPFSILDTRFNSRTLGRVRPTSCLSLSWVIMFQFTHPGKGATLRSSSSPTGRTSFNSRTLGRVRLSWSITKHNGASVSIHAPWEGCDVVVYLPYCKFTLFQFTHPGKGATDLSAHSR